MEHLVDTGNGNAHTHAAEQACVTLAGTCRPATCQSIALAWGASTKLRRAGSGCSGPGYYISLFICLRIIAQFWPGDVHTAWIDADRC